MEFELTPKSLKQRVAIELQLDHILLMKNENLEVPLLPKYYLDLAVRGRTVTVSESSVCWYRWQRQASFCFADAAYEWRGTRRKESCAKTAEFISSCLLMAAAAETRTCVQTLGNQFGCFIALLETL
jgi:hypothetical protein